MSIPIKDIFGKKCPDFGQNAREITQQKEKAFGTRVRTPFVCNLLQAGHGFVDQSLDDLGGRGGKRGNIAVAGEQHIVAGRLDAVKPAVSQTPVVVTRAADGFQHIDGVLVAQTLVGYAVIVNGEQLFGCLVVEGLDDDGGTVNVYAADWCM